MTPEEKFNQQVWKILQDIKEESLAPEEDGTFFYDTTKTVIVAGENSPTLERKIAIVRKLAREEKAIEIVKEIPPDWRGERNGFHLKVLQPQFDKVYEKHEKACDLTTYLNDYQERTLKGDDNLPEFGQVKNTDDKEKTTPATPIKHKGQMFERGSGGGYYNRSHPIRPMKKQSANEMVDEFSPENYSFVLTTLKKIASLTEFSADNEVHYKLQSPFGQAIIQERSLLKKFEARGLFRHLEEDGVFGIATLGDVDIGLVRQIIAEIEKRESGAMTSNEFEEIKKENKSFATEAKLPTDDDKSKQPSTLRDKPISLSKRELRKKINNIVKTGKFGIKEKAFLSFLSKDFESKTIEEISKEVSTKACKTLKARVQKKLKNTGFFIDIIRSDRWGGKSHYQLKFLTSSVNS